MSEIETLLEAYWDWLRDKTTVREIEGWAEITTPFLDRHNDYLQIYARRENGAYVLTDDGYTVGDLEQSGCTLDTPKRQGLLRATLNGFGVQSNGKAIEVHATPQNFALKKHNLVQAMLAVNDLFYLASPVVESFFYEDVAAWLDTEMVRYTPQVKFTGVSGFDHLFDFVIPKSAEQPERVVRTINRPDRQAAQTVAFAWIDTKDIRTNDSRAYAILNDGGRRVPEAVLDALTSYGVQPVPWSRREEASVELAA